LNSLKRLEQFGQSPWLDFIQRSFTANGSLQKLVDEDGLKGITSNPSIFQKAMGEGTDYDEGFKALAATGDHDALDIYEALAEKDIQHACDLMHPVYEATHKVDGYVSLEVSPYLALRTDDTVAEARRLWKAVARPNLMVKVPGTDAGTPAVRILIGDGLNINVTLLFSIDAYKAVAEAFIAGLEQRMAKGLPVAGIASVASFFVSRIDAVMDKKIDERKDPALLPLRGKIAIANARIAYQHYLALIGSDRWKKLAAAGAQPQRLLWASTGVKDKAYSDVLYVEELIGRDTVNTIPPATMDAFRDHGKCRESLTEGVDAARKMLADAETHGLDLAGVTAKLVQDGVEMFAAAADGLLGSVAKKRAAMLGTELSGMTAKLPPELDAAVKITMEEWRKRGLVRDLWAHDAKLWTGDDEAKWLGWLRVVQDRERDLPALQAFQDEIRSAGFDHVLLLGMGGSSLGPEVLAETFGHQPGYPALQILDSTDPAQIAALASSVDLKKTLCIVSSKSGGTLEPNIFKAFFWDRMGHAVQEPGQHFVAVTDPGSKVAGIAAQDKFRHVFLGDPTIGGRYSVLSNFGIVPAAAMGLDLKTFLHSASLMTAACASGTPPAENPGVQLGAILGTAAKMGRDKVTVIASPGIADMGAWLEQLIAESTGKLGHGIVPVDDEPLGAPGVYGTDRVFAYLQLAGETQHDGKVAALEAAGQPVIRFTLTNKVQIAQQFFLWEFATAVAGAVIGINAFNQPDVEASKIETKKLTDAVAKDGKLPDETPFVSEDGLKLFTDPTNQAALPKSGLDAVIKAHMARAGTGDYVALLAYIDRTPAHIETLRHIRNGIRDKKHTATCVGFGPRFLHSTGQAYKGGPNTGVFLQITGDDAHDLDVPGGGYTFGTVKAAQARGDFEVLTERKRRALRVHLGPDRQAGLARLAQAIQKGLS